MGRVLVASQLDDAFTRAIAARAGSDVDIISIPRGELEALPKEAAILIAAPFRRAGGELRGAPPPGWPFGLRWVQLVSVGIDFYPHWLFAGPTVTSARGSSAIALAEFSLAAIFAETKRLPNIWIDSAEDWRPTPLQMVEGGTLGIFGFGAIGEALAPRAQALGLNVIATRRSADPIRAPGVERVSCIGELFARADHVVLAAPATPETLGIVNREVLRAAKPGLHLINVARGALIDDAALLEALDAGAIARATLDVTHPEPLPEGHAFYTHPKIRLSPHTSVHTPDTRAKLALSFADNLARFLTGAQLHDVVDIGRGY